jgi:hypothetical protein
MTVSVDAAWNNAVEQIKGSAHQPSAAFHWNPDPFGVPSQHGCRLSPSYTMISTP